MKGEGEQKIGKNRTEGKKNFSDEEVEAKLGEELGKIEVKNLVAQMMVSLSSIGYLKLGLPEDANKKFKDLKQAQLAIDSLAALIEAAESCLSQEEVKTFKNTLANLRMNYVAQSKQS